MNGMARRVGFELSDPRQAATSSRASRSIGLVACGRSQEVAALAMEPLQTRLRKATRKAHSLSDALVNMKLVAALRSRERFAQALSLFYPVFAEVQRLLSECRGRLPVLREAAEVWQAMDRKRAFEANLRAIMGDRWTGEVQKSPCQPYLGHLRHLAESQPVRLLAYAYVLGMALTAGGKVIRKRIKEALGESASTRAFEFENIDGGDAGVAKRLRALLSAADGPGPCQLSAGDKDAVVDEAIKVYEHNNALVAQYQGTRWEAFNTAVRMATGKQLTGATLLQLGAVVLVAGALLLILAYRTVWVVVAIVAWVCGAVVRAVVRAVQGVVGLVMWACVVVGRGVAGGVAGTVMWALGWGTGGAAGGAAEL